MNDTVVIGGNQRLRNTVSGQANLRNVQSGAPNSSIRAGGRGGISNAVKEALLDCFEHVAWIDDDGQVYYQALYDALYAKVLSSISAVFEQGQAVIYDDDTLDDLKQYLTVTGTYDDGSTAIITTYTLSGTLNPGTSSIQVIYEGKQTSFNVTVTHRPGVLTITNVLNSCTTNNSAVSLMEGDPYTATITADSHYTLTGASVSITMGGVDITASAYNNGSISIAEVTGSLVITITAVAVTLVSISAVYTQGGTVYDTDSLDSLKTDLVVTATYSDSSTETVTTYTLSGTLTVGTSTITVTYSGKTTTFNVTVTSSILYELSAPTTFTGSNYIDTQFALMETDIDFTIMIKLVNGTPSNNARIFHCVNESGTPYQGIQFYESSSTLMFSGQSTTAVTLSSYPVTENTEINVCIRHEAGTSQYYFDGTVDGVRQAQYTMVKNKTAQLTNEPLYIGCAKTGTSTRYKWKGTINEFVIKGAYVSDSDVTAYLES